MKIDTNLIFQIVIWFWGEILIYIDFLQIRTGNTTVKSDLTAYKYRFEDNAMDNGFIDERNKCFCREGKSFINALNSCTRKIFAIKTE